MASRLDNLKKGDELMVFIKRNNKWESIAFATSHTFNITSNTVSVAAKDFGAWGATTPTTVSWEITSENLYTDGGYDELFDLCTSREPITLIFGYAGVGNAATSDGEQLVKNGLADGKDYWEADNAKSMYSGTAYLTALNLNAATGENATFSVTFSGAGAINKISELPA